MRRTNQGGHIPYEYFRNRNSQPLRDQPVGVNYIYVLSLQNAPQSQELRKKKKWKQQITPAISSQIGKNSTLICEPFPSRKTISETNDVNIIHSLETLASICMGRKDEDVELIAESPAKFENERGLFVIFPARKGGGQDQNAFLSVHCPCTPAW
jgi:hypothetical protein